MLHYRTTMGRGLGTQDWVLEQLDVYEKTEFQQVCIGNVFWIGKSLFLDDRFQSAINDVEPYHNALVRGFQGCKDIIKDALVIGFGPGASSRKLLETQPSIKRLVEIDIDQRAVELYRIHLYEWHHNYFTDARVETHILDASDPVYLFSQFGSFDAIIVDLTEPFNRPSSFYNGEWLAHCAHKLLKTRESVLMAQSGYILDALHEEWTPFLRQKGCSVGQETCPEVGWSFTKITKSR